MANEAGTDRGPDRPDVSFAIACYNAAAFLETAVASALEQTGVSIEVLIVDDHSQDDSLALAHRLAARDGRIRVLQTPQNGGPSAARNFALQHMRGRWYAILDADDFIDPDRSRRLLDAAEAAGADLVADDLKIFGEAVTPGLHVGASDLAKTGRIDMKEYLERSRLFGKKTGLGFLKPMIRHAALEAHDIRYRTDLRIGEDDELIMQCLLAGLTYLYLPESGYHYRKHADSISHRLSVDHAQRMMDAENALRARLSDEVRGSRDYRRRWSSIRSGLAFVTSVDQIKQRRFGAAAGTLLRCPPALLLYRMPIAAAWDRRRGKKA